MKRHLLLPLLSALSLAPLLHAAPPPPTISFQGRLLDPATGQAKRDGDYEARFFLFNTDTGGSASWQERKTVSVSNGFFSTLLGDTDRLDPANFDQEHLWLGIQVEGDPEMTPRHQISWAPYAIEAFQFQGHQPGQFLRSDTWDTMTVNNATNDALVISQASDRAALRATSQADSPGEATIRGIAGSAAAININSAAAVLGTSQNQRGVIGISDTRDGVFGWSTDGDGVDGESINGYGVYAYSANDHAIYAGGTGTISAQQLVYRTPRTHYSSVPGDVFRPRVINSSISYASSVGTGGAFITTGNTYAMNAPVHLPHGAVVTGLTAVLQDDSPTVYLSCKLDRTLDTGYQNMATVDTNGQSGIATVTTANITAATVDNQNYAYLLFVFASGESGSWASEGANLRIKRVSIEYQVSEAP